MGQVYNTSWEQQDIRAVIDGCRNWGVKSGLGVTESSPAAMSVLLAAGTCEVDNIEYEAVLPQNVAIAAADVTNPRKDIIVYDTSADQPAAITGTPAAAPVAPDVPADDIYLGMVHIAANAVTIANVNIDEGRVYVDPLPAGLIMMWHGLIVNIPTGWLKCDGTQGTPDLRASFVRGAPGMTEAGTTGGADTHTLTVGEMPAHSHKVGSSSGGVLWGIDNQNNNTDYGYVNSETVGGGGAHNNLPAFYEIIYIMKT